MISDNKILIKRIKNELYTKSGNLNSALIRREYFLNGNLFKEILKFTNFLEPNATTAERIYCICNELKESPKCTECNKPLQWRGFKNKPYSKSCNSSICKRKNAKWKSCSETKIENNKKIKELFLQQLKKEIVVDQQELKNFCKDRLKIKTPFNLQLLKTHTNFLLFLFQHHYSKPKDLNIKWSKLFYDYCNEITSYPKCQICQKNLTFKNSVSGYSGCSNSVCLQIKAQKNKTTYKINDVNLYLQNNNLTLLTNHLLNDDYHDIQCNQCNLNFKSFINNGRWKSIYCKNCNPNKSKQELEISKFIKELNCEYVCNDRNCISPKELDLFLPQHSLAIECNGIYWHSEQQGKDKKYHLTKSILCEQKNIQLLQFWDTEWIDKQEIVKSFISNKLNKNKNKIGARNCEIKQITDKNIKTIFLNKNHLQGNDNSQIVYGLFWNEELVSLMTFGHRKITGSDKNEWELIRFCNKLNFSVVGASSKLLKFFIKKHNPSRIITYADRRYSNGNLYYKLGFSLKHKSPPGYWYIVNGELKHRSGFMKHRLCNILKKYNDNMTEYQNMLSNGYDRVWDCGQFVFVMDL